MTVETSHASNIYQLISVNAETAPQADAILASGRPAMRWAGLKQQVDEALGVLHGAGLGCGSKIAMVMPNGPEMASAFLTVAAGMTSAPLNPAYRKEELEFYLEDLQADAVIVSTELDTPVRDVARVRRIPVIELEPSRLEAAGCFRLTTAADDAGDGRGRMNCAEDVALILHTSGTTSRPKMVPLSSANICSSAYNVQRTLALGPQDRCLNIMPLFHIHGLIANVMGTLAGQGCIFCTPGFDDTNFFSWYQSFLPTWYSAVPTMHQAILQAAPSHARLIAAHPLRFIRSSSASLAPAVMRRLEETFRCPVIEAYGMTEAAHQMASNPLSSGKQKARSVGLPAGPQIAILGETGLVLRQGEIGEIAIRGQNVTTGYLVNPTANEAAFSNGWFRTGDQGYLDKEGYLFLTGRLKEIINRGGEKVMPREIDEVLMSHPGIHQAVAFAVPHETLGEDVAAAVVLAEQSTLRTQQIRAYAFEHLADFKVPSQVILVDAIPKGPTGKLQRIGLAEMLKDLLAAAYCEPHDDLEQLLADIFADVLNLDAVGTEDNFFTLGGDSLSGSRVITRINYQLDVNLPMVALFRHPTIGELAVELRKTVDPKNLEVLSEILSELEEMSDEEARARLQQ